MERVNLYSDTQTRPTPGMRKAIAEAEVGDEQRFMDPTVNALQERVADLLGHEAALFLPTGTMSNEISFRLHIRPGGDEMLCDRTAHPIIAEAGGPAAIAGAMIQPLDGDGGIFTADQVRGALHHPDDRYHPRSRLVSVEQTTNMGGGRVWPLGTISDVLGVVRENGLRAHLDGARLMNACVASGVKPAEYASDFDTAWLDFSKGLGTPFGAVLCGSAELIKEAWRFKQMMGGSLRQAGIIAAACDYALDNHVERLADDHANARVLADGIAEVPGIRIDASRVETNIVIFETDDAPALVGKLWDAGIEVTPLGQTRIRMVTHMDVDRAGCERVVAAIKEAMA
jgi:threonine aldolase